MQERVSVTPNSATDFTASDFITSKFNTNGFSTIFIHCVTAWSSPTNPTREDSVGIVPRPPNGVIDVGWSAKGFAGQVNRSAVVRVLYPVHLSGPYEAKNTIFTVTTTAGDLIVEVDATLC